MRHHSPSLPLSQRRAISRKSLRRHRCHRRRTISTFSTGGVLTELNCLLLFRGERYRKKAEIGVISPFHSLRFAFIFIRHELPDSISCKSIRSTFLSPFSLFLSLSLGVSTCEKEENERNEELCLFDHCPDHYHHYWLFRRFNDEYK